MKQFEQMRDMMKGMNKMAMFGKTMPGTKKGSSLEPAAWSLELAISTPIRLIRI
jgi:hypothetical protein